MTWIKARPICQILHIFQSFSSLWHLRTHITSTLIHTKAPHGKLAYAFIDLLQWPHGGNLTLTICLKSICEHQKSHPLSKNLYIQMDNTCRVNKSRYVLCMCAVLVLYTGSNKYFTCVWVILTKTSTSCSQRNQKKSGKVDVNQITLTSMMY